MSAGPAGTTGIASLADRVRARPRLRAALLPLVVVYRAFVRPVQHGRRRAMIRMLARVVEGTAVFQLSEFGGEYEIDLRSDLARSLFLRGSYERNLALLCQRMIDPGRDALDIGANIGLYTGLMAFALTPGKRVLSLEPSPPAYRILLRNIERNNIGDRVIALQIVASNRMGDHRMSVCAGREEFATCGTPVHPSIRGRTIEHRVVAGATVDALCARYELEPGTIKIDVEGYEYNVLLGAEETIHRCRPVILAEVSDSMLRACGADSKALLDWLAERGYQLLDASCPRVRVRRGFQGEVFAVPSDFSASRRR